MTALYIILGTALVHVAFLLNPYYRIECGDFYTELPWTERRYRLFRDALKEKKLARARLVENWLAWPLRILLTLAMPVLYLWDRNKKGKAGEVHYSEDGKTLLKADQACRYVKARRGTETIASNAFDDTWAETILLPGTTKAIGDEAFIRTSRLRRIHLSDNIESIGAHVFAFCGDGGREGTGLREMALPRHLHFLGREAFYGCQTERLTLRGDFTWTPEWIENGNPFGYLPRLKGMKSENPHFIVENEMLMSADRKIVFLCFSRNQTIVVPDGVEQIAQGALGLLAAARRIMLPETTWLIGERAFFGDTSLDDVVLPSRLKSLGSEAFGCCRSLRTVTFPMKTGRMGSRLFDSSDNLETIILPPGTDNILRAYAEKELERVRQKREKDEKGRREFMERKKRMKEERQRNNART